VVIRRGTHREGPDRSLNDLKYLGGGEKKLTAAKEAEARRLASDFADEWGGLGNVEKGRKTTTPGMVPAWRMEAFVRKGLLSYKKREEATAGEMNLRIEKK